MVHDGHAAEEIAAVDEEYDRDGCRDGPNRALEAKGETGPKCRDEAGVDGRRHGNQDETQWMHRAGDEAGKPDEHERREQETNSPERAEELPGDDLGTFERSRDQADPRVPLAL